MFPPSHFRQILDIVPKLCRLYFLERLPVTLSYAQTSVLLSMGLQRKDVSNIEVCHLTYLLISVYANNRQRKIDTTSKFNNGKKENDMVSVFERTACSALLSANERTNICILLD